MAHASSRSELDHVSDAAKHQLALSTPWRALRTGGLGRSLRPTREKPESTSGVLWTHPTQRQSHEMNRSNDGRRCGRSRLKTST